MSFALGRSGSPIRLLRPTVQPGTIHSGIVSGGEPCRWLLALHKALRENSLTVDGDEFVKKISKDFDVFPPFVALILESTRFLF